MDLVNGPDLALLGGRRSHRRGRGHPLGDGDLRCARHAHERGIVHCDLKPANLLLDEGGRIRVTDFGLARSLAEDTPWAAEVEGTAPFMAPEQASRCWGPIDHRTDVYGIGAVLFALLTGRPPVRRPQAPGRPRRGHQRHAGRLARQPPSRPPRSRRRPLPEVPGEAARGTIPDRPGGPLGPEPRPTWPTPETLHLHAFHAAPKPFRARTYRVPEFRSGAALAIDSVSSMSAWCGRPERVVTAGPAARSARPLRAPGGNRRRRGRPACGRRRWCRSGAPCRRRGRTGRRPGRRSGRGVRRSGPARDGPAPRGWRSAARSPGRPARSRRRTPRTSRSQPRAA